MLAVGIIGCRLIAAGVLSLIVIGLATGRLGITGIAAFLPPHIATNSYCTGQ